MAHDPSRRPADAAPAGGARIAAVVSRYHAELTGAMLESARRTLREAGWSGELETVWVPGAFELPVVAQRLAQRPDVDAVLCIGLVLKGETRHDEHIARAVVEGLVRISLDTGTPCLFGVLTCATLEQARVRAGLAAGAEGPDRGRSRSKGRDEEKDKGRELGRAALEVLDALARASAPPLSAPRAEALR